MHATEATGLSLHSKPAIKTSVPLDHVSDQRDCTPYLHPRTTLHPYRHSAVASILKWIGRTVSTNQMNLTIYDPSEWSETLNTSFPTQIVLIFQSNRTLHDGADVDIDIGDFANPTSDHQEAEIGTSGSTAHPYTMGVATTTHFRCRGPAQGSREEGVKRPNSKEPRGGPPKARDPARKLNSCLEIYLQVYRKRQYDAMPAIPIHL